MNKKNFNIAFTMAEILLSLTIIGVVAAITLPSLTGNINEKTWNTQRKALYARMSQAVALMPYINGYGVGATNSDTKNNAAKAFVTEGLSKVLKMNNICDNAHFKDCGINSKYTDIGGSKKTFPTTNYLLYAPLASQASHSGHGNDSYSLMNINAAAFETANGESIAVFYQPFCINNKVNSNLQQYWYTAPYMCANFVFDLNGLKGPNTVGKDIGYITVMYPTNPFVVMPQPLPKDTASGQTEISAVSVCRSVEDARIPNKEEFASMMFNSELNGINKLSDPTSLSSSSTFYSVARDTGFSMYWKAVLSSAAWSTLVYNGALRVRCIKR